MTTAPLQPEPHSPASAGARVMIVGRIKQTCAVTPCHHAHHHGCHAGGFEGGALLLEQMHEPAADMTKPDQKQREAH